MSQSTISTAISREHNRRMSEKQRRRIMNLMGKAYGQDAAWAMSQFGIEP
ncbi:hypothetical protein [Bifidobacterium moukalabense]|nr:hypothetical protein [Bifidobacterium moukalabense]